MAGQTDVAPLILGAHLSISKGIGHALYEAAVLGCGTVQVFTKNANTWREKALTEAEIAAFEQAREETGITKVFSHCSYLINIAGNDGEKSEKSVNALYRELFRCGQLRIPYVVLHPGSHMGHGEENGIERIARNLDTVLERTGTQDTMILLENTAGQGSALGHTFEQLSGMRERSGHGHRIGFCLDTCHMHAAGYDITTETGYMQTLEMFDRTIGLSHLRLIHLNDAMKPFGSRVDRHAHIGEGYIGESGFARIVNDPRLRPVPMIIETPKEKDGMNADPLNLTRLRRLCEHPSA